MKNFVEITSTNLSAVSENFQEMIEIYKRQSSADIHEFVCLLETFTKVYPRIKDYIQRNAGFIDTFALHEILAERCFAFRTLSNEFLG